MSSQGGTAAAALRDDARAVWSAAIAAVAPARLVARRLTVEGPGRELRFDGRPLDPPVHLDRVGRIAVVGAGKAAAGMAAGVAELLGPGRVSGLVGVPAGAGGRFGGIEVRETRPAAANLPTAAAVAATREMLGIVSSLGPDDLAIAVVTGGGSALLVAPREGVPLEEKIAVAGFLSRAGADIGELNAVRQAASVVKAGGLARACGAGRLVVLVLSDVIGDPLDVIASGPCMPVDVRPSRALAILRTHGAVDAGVCPRLAEELAAAPADTAAAEACRPDGSWTTARGCRVTHLLLGTNATAVEAAAAAAAALGYLVEWPRQAAAAAGSAGEVGSRLAAAALAAASAAAADGRPRAIVEGGEATVMVPPDHGVGGRNQQTVLAAVEAVRPRGSSTAWPDGLFVASVGTDGEDGPTDAAGGFCDAGVVAAIDARRLDVSRASARCDAYPLLAAAGGLIRTGQTGTNVADVRIVLARP